MSGVEPAGGWATARSRGPSWRSWSGTARCRPARVARPRDEAEVVEVVRTAAAAGSTLRVAGSGHSFNHLACTAGTLVDLAATAREPVVDDAAATVTVDAGTTLAGLTAALDRRGLALPTLGTLTAQRVVGAVVTGTHGTGLGHGPLSDLVVGLTMVTADGSVRRCGPDEDPELFRCARTSLGALGVVTSMTLRVVPRFTLRVVPGRRRLDDLLDDFAGWAAGADHPSVTWLPWRDAVATRDLQRTGEARTTGAGLRRWATTLDEVRCGAAGAVGTLVPRAVPRLAELPAPGGGTYVAASHEAFAFPQPVRFLALEHALPLAAGPPALRALRGALRRFGVHSPYAVLVRVGSGTDEPLSPAAGRATAYVNVTVPRAAAYIEILRLVEHVLRAHDGRPHWGKAHTATADVLRPRYPGWADFQRQRARLDPAGLFTSDYVSRVLGPVGDGVPVAGPGRAGAEVPA